jgi:hypothetical protein
MAEVLVSKRLFEEMPVNCAFVVKVVVPKGQAPTTVKQVATFIVHHRHLGLSGYA